MNPPIVMETSDMFPYEIGFSPSTYECGPGERMKIHSLMLHLQEAAARHADVLGVGMDWMKEHGIMWVLINFRLDIMELPSWEEETTIWTWPSGYDSLRAFREFSGRSSGGKDLFLASSDWLVLDMEKKMPVPFTELKLDIPQSGIRNFKDMGRLKEGGRYDPLQRIVVGRSSIDMNGHVNNTEYVRWGLDSIAAKGLFPDMIGSLSITFTAEVFEGDDISIAHSVHDGVHHIKGDRGSKNTFLMEVHTYDRPSEVTRGVGR
jgi:medium-chain acyl-[acyl-carrier-protein] hydrolase